MASSFFSPKSTGTRLLTAICNLIIVNFLFLITCIPIFTIGASITALYRITIAILAGDNPAVLRDYFKSFRDNFLKATALELLYAALLAFFGFEIYMVNTMMDPKYSWAQYPAYFFVAAIFASACYAFPLLAWFEETFKQILKNSLLIALSNIPVTIMFIVITGILPYISVHRHHDERSDVYRHRRHCAVLFAVPQEDIREVRRQYLFQGRRGKVSPDTKTDQQT